MKLSFYSDPGHGWLAVPLELLDRLQLLDRVSGYSYLRGRLAPLEEDCDASLFLAAARDAGIAVTFRDIHCADRHSRIRNYDPYSPARAKNNLANLRGAVL
jgi:hypothetical protein